MSRSIKSADAEHIEKLKEIEREILRIKHDADVQKTRAICGAVVICVMSICGLLAYMHTPGIVHFVEAIGGAFIAASASIAAVIRATDMRRRNQVEQAKRPELQQEADTPTAMSGQFISFSKGSIIGAEPEDTDAE
jgi:hypothetical protein